MRRYIKLLNRTVACLLAAMFVAALPVMADSVIAPATNAPQTPLSVFKLPTNPKEGRDPFFPNSSRPYEGAAVPNHSVADIHTLLIQGFSGKPPHQLVIINNVTFGAGDDAEVRTPDGRIHVHCVGISSNSAVISVNGQEHTIRYQEKP